MLDTVRFDAVSANGGPAGLTPTVDAVAAEGVRYTHAYAAANWTLPSHVSLFTGLLPAQHRVSAIRPHVPDELVTLAERLRDAGYDTVGISENPWVTKNTNLTQGFDRFDSVGPWGFESLDVGKAVDDWLATRTVDRPFFLFVNVMEAHAPYKVRATNPWLPAGVDADAARSVLQKDQYVSCGPAVDRPMLDVQRGLYLGGVAADDEKLAAVLARLRARDADRGLVTILTSDHGEQFGEHRFVLHDFGVHEPLIHVPLVVRGAPAGATAVVDTPVSLIDVVPSVLGWAGVAVPGELRGRPLPTRAAPDDRALVAEYVDPESDEATEAELGRFMREKAIERRRSCGPTDRADGTSRALVAWPLKLVAYERYPAALFDLAADPGELGDLAAARPADVARLAAVLAAETAGGAPAPAAPSGTVDPAVLDRLKALGYVGDRTSPGAPAPAPGPSAPAP